MRHEFVLRKTMFYLCYNIFIMRQTASRPAFGGFGDSGRSGFFCMLGGEGIGEGHDGHRVPAVRLPL